MSAIKIQQFGGMLPAWDPAILPANQAETAQNCYLFSGALTGWRAPKLLRTLTNPSAKSAFRVPTLTRAQASATLTFSSQPNDGDTVKVGEETYRFKTVMVQAYDIARGANTAASITALLAALNIGINSATDAANVGVLFFAGTETNPVVSLTAGDNTATATTLTVLALDFGAAYNSTVVAESTGGVRMSWSGTTFTGGTNPTFDNSITGAATWLEFTDQDTDMLRSPVVDDKFNRVYFASPSQPPQYNTYDRVLAAASPWMLGLNPPGCAPGVSISGGGNSTGQLGNTAENATPGNTYSFLANTMVLIPIKPTGTTTLADVFIVLEAVSTGANFTGFVYSDNAGAPGNLLGTSEPVPGVATNAYIPTFTFLNPPTLQANTQYWIGVMTDTTIPIERSADTGPTSYSAPATYSNGPPAVAPAVTPTNAVLRIIADVSTSAVLETRAYVYTWVSAYGEESPPSPPTIVTGWNNAIWTIDLFTPPPDDMGVLRNITKKRLYRTISAVGGQTDYFLVTPDVSTTGGIAAPDAGDLDVNLATYVDSVLDDTIAGNTILPSTSWFPPPEGLQGIVSMPNGMMAGFKSNEIWFCEPYRPHAWPPEYVITTEFPIVGLGVTGNSVVAATNATPYIATGINPGSMTLLNLMVPEPCTSRRSVVSTLAAVYYASPNGLIAVTGNGVATNITESWITRDKWRALTPPSGIHAIGIAGAYFAFGTVTNGDNTYAQTGFTIELQPDAASFSIWPQPGGHRLGFNKMTAPGGFDIYNVLNDPWTGIGMLIQNGGIYYYDFSDAAPTITPFKWRSKRYQQPAKKNFEAMKVFFNVPPGTPAQGARNTADTNDPSWNTLAANQYGIIRVYADTGTDDTPVLVTTREIRTSGEMLRILSGFKAEFWQWEIEGRVNISNLQVATNARELGGV